MRSALKKVPGVVSAEVTYPDRALVQYDPKKVTHAKLIQAVKDAGYKASVKKETQENPPKK